MSVATGGAVLGTVVLVTGSTSAAASPTASAAAAHPHSASAVPGAASGVSISIPSGPSPDSATPRSSSAPVSASASRDDLGSPVSVPFDPAGMTLGFDGPYRFVAHLRGLPGLMNLGGIVEGAVTDPAHFVLDFPESTFITRYTRDGSSARAVINGRAVTVEPGLDTAGAISPEDMLPRGVWGQIIALWEPTLRPDGTAGAYAANTGTLTDRARSEGIHASNWQLSAKTDGSGRLTSLAFSGLSWDQSFELDLVVLYG